jgi:hypothetical protein
MPRFSIVKAFKVFLAFPFKVLSLIFSLFKGFAMLSVYSVGIFSFLLFEIAILSRVFLFFSAKIIV